MVSSARYVGACGATLRVMGVEQSDSRWNECPAVAFLFYTVWMKQSVAEGAVYTQSHVGGERGCP